VEIQKVLPPDDVLLAVSKNPKFPGEEIALSQEEFKMFSLINGERTLPDLINASPMGEFVTCRAVYRLIVNNLIEIVGKRQEGKKEEFDEEKVVLEIVFHLYNQCFYRLRQVVEDILGEDNNRFSNYASQYRTGVFTFFPGVDPNSELMPQFDRFLSAARKMPQATRYYHIMSGLETMLAEQLEYVYSLLGKGIFREAAISVKKEIAEPLATHRELVKRYSIEENFYKSVKRADKVVRMIRG
jgi:hypothetical protein